MLNTVDISSWQAGIDVSKLTTTKAVVVKATESTTYVNEYMGPWADAVLASGKKLGLYHYASPGDAIKQARFFLSKVKKWYGKFIPCLDWEDDAVAQGPEWALTWLDHVFAKTGVRGMVYMSKSVCNAWDWSEVADAGYLLWVAQYPNYERTGFLKFGEIWTDGSPFGAWAHRGGWTMIQYTSSGRVKGYAGNLDLSLFSGTARGWDSIAAGSVLKQAVAKVIQTAKADTATPKWRLMVDMAVKICGDDSHGYSQRYRWGPDYDCSSLMFYCADYAGYGVDMHEPRYTGSMIEKFTACGFKKIAFNRSKLVAGDILLSHNDSRRHTELYIGNGMTAGAHIAETGDVHGVQGDQTGNEISVQALSWTPDWILRPPDSGAEAAQETAGLPYTVRIATRVRTARSVYSGKVAGKLAKGQTVRLDRVRTNRKGNTWGRIAAGPFKGRFIAVRFDGKNRLLKAGSKSVEEVAREVIAGEWGNGEARRDALAKKGYDPDVVQERVNELIG